MVIVSNVSSRYIGEDDDDVSVAIKADVENNSDGEQVYVDLQGVDSDGFELDSTILSSKIPIGSKKTVSTKLYVAKDTYKEIVKWQEK